MQVRCSGEAYIWLRARCANVTEVLRVNDCHVRGTPFVVWWGGV